MHLEDKTIEWIKQPQNTQARMKELQRKIDKSVIIMKDFNISLAVTDMTSKEKN